MSFIVAFVLGAYFVTTGRMSVGALIAFIQLLNHVTWPFTGLAGLWGSMQHGLGAADRIFELMSQPAEYGDFPDERRRTEKSAGLELRDVCFAYGERETLAHLNMTVEAGKMTAVVGPSGAGKTTLFKLLLGLHKPKRGTIVIGGRDAEAMALAERRGYFSIVPQETVLFSGTVRDNIADGRTDASFGDIRNAAACANADGFIRELPDGYDTQIGERGTRLSGGQKQRIAIARALLRDAPVLLLDEATAALDNESEKLIQEALETVMTDRTTLVIAHRLSTVRRADTIHVMDQGRIVESGTHEDLLARRGLYYRLYHRQFHDQEAHDSAG